MCNILCREVKQIGWRFEELSLLKKIAYFILVILVALKHVRSKLKDITIEEIRNNRMSIVKLCSK